MAAAAASAAPAPAADSGESHAPGLSHIDIQMTTLRQLLDREYQRIKEEWEKIILEKDGIDKIKNRITSVSVAEHERLKMNVGGVRFEIRASSVQKNTYFRSLHSGTFTPPDTDGFYYIDRDPTLMHHILSWMREGDMDFESFSERQLEKLRSEAEFYMVQELQAKLDALRNARRSRHGLQAVSINRDCASFAFFNGIVFEINVTQRELRLHSIAFISGEKRKIVGEIYIKAGAIDAPGRFEKLGDVDEQVEKLQLVSVAFSAVTLSNPVYTIAVYSASCPTAVAVCPKSSSQRDYRAHGFQITKSYYTSDPRGQFTRRAGAEDDFDFAGDITVSLP